MVTHQSQRGASSLNYARLMSSRVGHAQNLTAAVHGAVNLSRYKDGQQKKAKHTAMDLKLYRAPNTMTMAVIIDKEVQNLGDNEDLKRNGSGYIDPSAYAALKNISNEERRVSRLIKSIRMIAHLCGYDITNRIELKNLSTGRRWR